MQKTYLTLYVQLKLIFCFMKKRPFLYRYISVGRWFWGPQSLGVLANEI